MAAPDNVDQETRELVVKLLTRAGMIMEDASAVAILSAGRDTPIAEAVREVEHASAAVSVLVSAAAVLIRG